jgi:hypothetical protein
MNGFFHTRSDLVRVVDDEAVAVRHLYLRQRLRIHFIVVADEFVERKNIRGQRINFFVAVKANTKKQLKNFLAKVTVSLLI